MTSASKLIVDILNPIKRTLQLKSGDKVAVLVNNLGGMSQLEQWIVCGIVQKQIRECFIFQNLLMPLCSKLTFTHLFIPFF